MNFAENNRISHRQLYRQIMLTFTSPFLLCLFQTGKLSGVMGMLGTVIATCFLFFYVIFLIRLAPKYENLRRTCGSFCTWIITVFYLCYTVLTNAYLVSVLMRIVPDSLLEGVSEWWIGILTVLVCAHGSFRGMQKRGRMADAAGGIFLFAVLLMLLLGMGQAKMSYLQEMFLRSSRSLGNCWKNGYGVLCAFSGISLLPFVLVHVEKNGSAWKSAVLGILSLSVILEGMLLLLPSAFGWDRLKEETMPVLLLLSGVNLPGKVLARFDVLWMGFLVFGLFYAIGSLFHYSHQIVIMTMTDVFMNTKSDKEKHRAEKIQQRIRILGIAVLALFVFVLAFYPKEDAGIEAYYFKYLGAVYVPGILILQIFMIYMGKEKRKKRLAAMLLSCITVLFTGCAGTEPEERMYPLAIAVQETENGLQVSYGMPDLQKMTGQEKEEEGTATSILTIVGGDFDEIEKHYQESQDKYLDLGHLKAILISKTMTEKENWKKLFHYLKTEKMVGEDIYVFEADDPEQILRWQETSGVSVGEYLTAILEKDKNEKIPSSVTLREVYYTWYEKNNLPDLPKVRMEENTLHILAGQSIRESQRMVWWGSLYPKFCFGTERRVENGDEIQERPKISFYLAKLLDWC